jgi:hypothetical protein
MMFLFYLFISINSTVMPRSSDTFLTLTHFVVLMNFFFIVLKLLIYA